MTGPGRKSSSLTKPTKDMPTRQQARKTALLVAGVLILIAALSYWRGRVVTAGVLGGIAALLISGGLFAPVWARRFHIAWMRLALLLGYINSRILLSLMYYGVFSLYGVVSKLAGRDPLKRRQRSRQQKSYWVPRKTTRQSKEQFERLF